VTLQETPTLRVVVVMAIHHLPVTTVSQRVAEGVIALTETTTAGPAACAFHVTWTAGAPLAVTATCPEIQVHPVELMEAAAAVAVA